MDYFINYLDGWLVDRNLSIFARSLSAFTIVLPLSLIFGETTRNSEILAVLRLNDLLLVLQVSACNLRL